LVRLFEIAHRRCHLGSIFEICKGDSAMTYQGERARPIASEDARVFAVSKVRIGPDGHVSDVLWAEVNAGSDLDVGAPVVATAAEVVDAIHDGAQVEAVFSAKERFPERAFVIALQENGTECIAFEGAPSPGRNITDLGSLDD
jgi:hypothetical protein